MPADYNITLEWTEKEISPNGSIKMEIVWNPAQAFTCKEKLYLIDDRNFKKEVFIVLKSIDKSVRGLSTVSTTTSAVTKTVKTTKKVTTFTKKLKMKSPSPPKRTLKKSTTTTSVIRNVVSNKTATNSGSMNFLVEIRDTKSKSSIAAAAAAVVAQTCAAMPLSQHNSTGEPYRSESVSYVPKGKENKSPTTPPTNASALFDQINFTPFTEGGRANIDKNDIEYLAALPTPKSSAIGVTFVRKPSLPDLENPETESPRCSELYTTALNMTENTINFQPETYSSVVRPRNLMQMINAEDDCPDLRRNLFELPNNKTFEIRSESLHSLQAVSSPPPRSYKSPKRSPKFVPTLNRTVNVSPRQLAGSLSTIAEEVSSGGIGEQCSGVHIEKASFTGQPSTPLSKKFQSMKDLSKNLSVQQQALKYNQGSMPNLRDCDAEVVKNGIETNRYYLQQQQQHIETDTNLNTSNCSTTSMVSVNDGIFKANEIRAQSSRFNVNDSMSAGLMTPKVEPMSFFIDIVDCSILTAPVSVKREEFVVPKVPPITARRNQSFRSDTSTASDSSSISKGSGCGVKRSRDSKQFCQEKRLKVDDSCGMSQRYSLSTTEQMEQTWNSTQPKKIRMTRNSMKLCLKRQSEERIILFDPEVHIQCK